MKILCGINAFTENVLHISETLSSMGHSVKIFNTDDFSGSEYCTNTLIKRLDKLGIKKWRKLYEHRKRQEYIDLNRNFSPDCILWVNIWDREDINFIKEYSADKTHFVWLVEGLRGTFPREYLELASKISSFEPKDVTFIKKELPHKDIRYVPIGFNNYYDIETSKSKKYDISFIGYMSNDRKRILNKVSKYAIENNLTVKFCGPFQIDILHFWKRIILKKKFPYLYRLATDSRISSKDVAQIYADSKICLNLGTKGHEGINPRTFEIMATGAMEIMNAKEDYLGLVHPGCDIEVFEDEEELLSKIDRYLKDDGLREKIALQGKLNCINKFTLKNSLNAVLE